MIYYYMDNKNPLALKTDEIIRTLESMCKLTGIFLIIMKVIKQTVIWDSNQSNIKVLSS